VATVRPRYPPSAARSTSGDTDSRTISGSGR
jgi:hypothetical protein